MITVQALTDKSRQAADLMALTGAIPAGFSFAAAEGTQLDDLAAASGLTRETGMTDEAFRAFCLAKLSLWTWDASGRNEGRPPACNGRHPNDLKQE